MIDFDVIFNSFSLQNLRSEILSLFECQKTGHCCRFEGYVYVSEEEISNMAKELRYPLSTFKEHYVIQDGSYFLISKPGYRKDCFLNCQNECQVYLSRPQQCRTYPNWDNLWQSKSSILKEVEFCSGLKKSFVILFENLKKKYIKLIFLSFFLILFKISFFV